MSEEDRCPVKMVAVIITTAIPLMLKLGLVYLKYKRKVGKREKYLRKELKKAGMEKDMINDICEDMNVLSLSDMIGAANMSKENIFGNILS
ncbi:MAG: hypothetical protein ACOC40_00205 [Thermoplasmatota archaeon]